MPRRKSSVTIHDVAAAAGVSVSTVSRVLNDKDDVAEETFDRVKRVIGELGYSSSLAARSMRSRRTNVVGLLTQDMHEPFSVEVLRGASRAAQECGHDLLTFMSGRRPAESMGEWEQRQVALLNGSITDGIVVVTPYADTFRTDHPLVAVDPHSASADFPAVISTNHQGALAAMDYLTGLGHRRIGFIGGRVDLQSTTRRLAGYRDGLTAAGIALDDALIQAGDFTRQSGYTGARALFELDDPPTAVFAANDASAAGVLDAAAEAGLRVPEDLSVVGFDNVPESAMLQPPLTTVDQSVQQMGYVALKMLIALVHGEGIHATIHKIDTKLIIRQSCAVPQRRPR